MELGRYLQRDPFPAALRIMQKTPGSGLGIYNRSVFAGTFRRYANADLGGKNMFTYSSANPVNRVDPTGMPDTNWDEVSASIWSPYEAAWAYKYAQEALDEARRANDAGEITGVHNGAADAYRHCLWSCLMTQKFGAGMAKEFGDAHEGGLDQDPDESVMDQYNNREGRALGDSNPGTDCKTLCQDAVITGQLRSFSPNGQDGPTVVHPCDPLFPTANVFGPPRPPSPEPPYNHYNGTGYGYSLSEPYASPGSPYNRY
jgi:hypothetical protein